MQEITKISISELKELSQKMYEPLVKAVVDVELSKVVVDAELHYDEEQFLLEAGSEQCNLWGINLWPGEYGADGFIEFDSMINIRPAQGNRSRGVENEQVQQQIRSIIAGVVHV